MLLAKSNPPIPLRQHTEEVVSALRDLRTIWPAIPSSIEKAAVFHDLGKAALGFQRALNDKSERWGFRHEILSAEIFRECCDLTDDENWLAYVAILTHHKNLGTTPSTTADVFRGCGSNSPGAPWFKKWQELLVQITDLKNELDGLNYELDAWRPVETATSPANEAPRILKSLQPALASPQYAVARGALVAADHLASAGLSSPRLGRNISRESLEIYARSQIENWNDWSELQCQASQQIGSTLLVAPTGAGKTEAALLWALRNRKGFERIFYVLPYQVSINAMAARLGKAFPDESGRSGVSANENLAVLHSNMDLLYLEDAQSEQLSTNQQLARAHYRVDAARKIYAPIKVTTIHQLLAIFFGRKFFEVGILELTNSIVIFDEIHAYDGHTQGLISVLLKCLNKLGARILIMTATLPTKLSQHLLASAAIPDQARLSLSEDSPLLAEVRREIKPDNRRIEEMIDEIRAAVLTGKRVVVVCNTVGKAITLFERLYTDCPLLVHSRFTLGDRASRETKENISSKRLVIATQVIEVSLDVSFDIMFTELAPADGLMQRFGRVNRHGKPDSGVVGICWIACGRDPGSERVYTAELLQRTKDHLPKGPLTFLRASQWIEIVYLQGLPEPEWQRMLCSAEDFGAFVEQLRPMVDYNANSIEKSLIDSVQVIPCEMLDEWKKRKGDGNYTDAKKLIVNVTRSSWENALRKQAFQAPESEDGWIVAPFKYDTDQGLLLDKPMATCA